MKKSSDFAATGLIAATITAIAAVGASLAVILCTGAVGLVVQYLFPVTFGELLAAIGLGKVALWQIGIVAGYLATLSRPFR